MILSISRFDSSTSNTHKLAILLKINFNPKASSFYPSERREACATYESREIFAKKLESPKEGTNNNSNHTLNEAACKEEHL